MEILENKKNMLIYKEGNKIIFISYKSRIAIWDISRNKLILNKTKWDYSQTTLKQLKYFINNYIENDFYTTKKEFIKRISKNNNIVLNDCL